MAECCCTDKTRGKREILCILCHWCPESGYEYPPADIGQGTVKTPGIKIPGIFPVVVKFHEIGLTKQSFRPDSASFTPWLE
jgi:hypothetical protein